jgi:integrase
MAQSTARRARRRSPGEGSVYKVDGGRRWRGAVTWTEPDGTRRRRVVSAPTAAEARERLDVLRRGLMLGAPIPKGRALTVGEYLTEWIERNRSRVRPSTWAAREQHVRLWLIPTLGRYTLARLSPADVERALAEFLRSGRPRGADAGTSSRSPRRVVSPLTIRHLRATLRMALSDAERDGLVVRNAAAKARPPRVPYAPISYLTPEQVNRLLDATREDEYGPLYALLVGSGLRLGEALGLAWRDIDQEAGTLTVRQTMALRADGTYGLSEPKTPRSRRTLPLTATARDALRRQRVRQDTARLAAGTAWQDTHGLVFTDAVGRGLRPRDVSHAFARAVRAYGLARVRLHDLRHTFATLALAEGVGLATVADLLGHTGVAITAAHYSAIVPELRREAAAAIDRAIGGGAR